MKLSLSLTLANKPGACPRVAHKGAPLGQVALALVSWKGFLVSLFGLFVRGEGENV